MNIAAYPRVADVKDSGVTWIGKIPEHWQVKRLRHLTKKIGSGITPTGGALTYVDDGIPLLRSQNVLFGRIELEGAARISERVHQRMSNSQVRKGDVLLNITGGSIGRCHFVDTDDDLNVNQHVCIIRPTRDIISRYLNFLLSSEVGQKQIWFWQQGGGREGLNFEAIKGFAFAIPPLPEQRAIAAFLDGKCAKIDEAVRIKESQIKLLAERRQILTQQAVTRGLNPAAPMKDSSIEWIGQIPAHWEVKRFKYLFEQSRLPVRPDDGVVTSFRDGQVTLRSNRRLEGYTEAIIEGGYQGIRKGQLVLNSMDAFEGAIGVSESDGKCTPEYVICDPIEHGLSQHYFAYLLREMALARYIQVICNAVRQRAVRIRYNNLAHRFMIVPPHSEQLAVVAFIENTKTGTGDAISIKEDQIAALKEYKTSLINAAVTGKIKVI